MEDDALANDVVRGGDEHGMPTPLWTRPTGRTKLKRRGVISSTVAKRVGGRVKAAP
jgi:hypothetical protein